MSKYIFQIDDPPSSIEREFIARQLIRNLEKIEKFQIEQLYENRWVAVKVHTPGNLRKLFKNFKDKRFKLKHDKEGVCIYVSEIVTPMDVRMLTGEIIGKLRTMNDSKLTKVRRVIGASLWRLGRYVYPSSKGQENL